jgi:hypothetical protein
MSAIIHVLLNEIARLKAERSKLIAQRSELVAPFDVHVANIDERLRAAERMLAAYRDARLVARRQRRLAGRSRELQGLPPRETLAKDINPTWADVERVEIPSSIRGHSLHPNSKRANIIRGTKALLQARRVAGRLEIVGFLKSLGTMGKEKNPDAYLSVVLSYANEIFETNGTEWFLRVRPKRS